MTSTKKDTRKIYNDEQIKVNGNVVRFDGKGDPQTKILKVYRYYGDITLQAEALQNFCIDNGYDEAIIARH